jgi:hypothetical protein
MSIPTPEVFMVGGPLVFLLVVLELVRRRRLREDYSLLWLATFGVLLILSLLPRHWLNMLANFIGIDYAPTAYLVIGFGLMLLVMLQFSMVISRLARENKQGAQQVALLSARVRDLERQLEQQQEEDNA